MGSGDARFGRCDVGSPHMKKSSTSLSSTTAFVQRSLWAFLVRSLAAAIQSLQSWSP